MNPPQPAPVADPLSESLSLTADLMELAEKQAADIKTSQARVAELEQQLAAAQGEIEKRASASKPALNPDKLDAALTHLQTQGFLSAATKQAAYRDILADPDKALSIMVGLANFIPPVMNPQGHTASISGTGDASTSSAWY